MAVCWSTLAADSALAMEDLNDTSCKCVSNMQTYDCQIQLSDDKQQADLLTYTVDTSSYQTDGLRVQSPSLLRFFFSVYKTYNHLVVQDLYDSSHSQRLPRLYLSAAPAADCKMADSPPRQLAAPRSLVPIRTKATLG